jgi:hypothetical protein
MAVDGAPHAEWRVADIKHALHYLSHHNAPGRH